MYISTACDLLVDGVIGSVVFLLTLLGEDPSNRRSGMGVGRSNIFSLFLAANFLSTKQCDEPESISAMNGQV